MPLTPADVQDIAFKKPSIGKRGYDEEEVDTFLDEVQRELSRLIEENKALRAQLDPDGDPSGDSAPDPGLAAEVNDLKAQLARLQRDKAAAEQAVQTMEAQLGLVRAQDARAPGADGQQRLHVLTMAQRTADAHLASAEREANKLLSDARDKANEVTREARAKADAVEREARRRHEQAIAVVEAERLAGLKRIEELEGFRREYRARLRAHLESQLRDLDGRDVDTHHVDGLAQELKAS